jgi:hypothetical protein
MKQASGQLFLPPDHITGNVHEVPFSKMICSPTSIIGDQPQEEFAFVRHPTFPNKWESSTSDRSDKSRNLAMTITVTAPWNPTHFSQSITNCSLLCLPFRK